MHSILKALATGICCLSAFTAGSPLLSPRAGQCEETSVLILGAGTAGITAAQALHNNSISDFIILEYNDEIGGRCRHTEFGQKPDGKGKYVIELGANWVQGLGKNDGLENPLFELSKQFHVKTHYSNYNDVVLYNASGPADYYQYARQYTRAINKIDENANEIMREGLLDQSMRAAFTEAGWIPNNPEMQAMEWVNWDGSQAISPDESSELFGIANENGTFGLFGNRNNFVIDQKGFNKFIYGIASSYLEPYDSRMRLNSIIKKVTYSDDSVTVHTKDNKCYKAQHAICTFSVGVLQESLPTGNAPVSFSPAFPTWKTQAITGFQMGIYTKIFLQFDPADKFWPDNQFFLYASPTTRGYYPFWQNLDLPGFFPGSGIIFVTVTTPMSRRAEAQSDEKTMHEVLDILRQMFPNKTIPRPKAFMYPRWGQQEWAFGSYSNWPAGYTLEQHQNLRANVGRLWFAGEHTSTRFFGYLHGAWFEGRTMGNYVARCLKSGGAECKQQVHYDKLRSTTKLREYTLKNGWNFPNFDGSAPPSE